MSKELKYEYEIYVNVKATQTDRIILRTDEPIDTDTLWTVAERSAQQYEDMDCLYMDVEGHLKGEEIGFDMKFVEGFNNLDEMEVTDVIQAKGE